MNFPTAASNAIGVPLSILQEPSTPVVSKVCVVLMVIMLPLLLVSLAVLINDTRAEKRWAKVVGGTFLGAGVSALVAASVVGIFAVPGAENDAMDAAHDANRAALKVEFPRVTFSDADIKCATDIATYRDTECESETVIVGQDLQTLKFEKIHGRLLVSLVTEGPGERLNSTDVLDRS
jgi:hypothetical protein